MKKIICYYVLMFALSLLGCDSKKEATTTPVKVKRIVIIGLDGISVDGYQKAKHPNMDSLMADGTLSLSTRNVMPSVTLPNWTTHLTGSGPEQHGVLGNNWKKDSVILPPIDIDGDGYYPSIFKVLKDCNPKIKTAFYYNWGNLINPINRRYLDNVSFEENDEYEKNYNKAFDFILKNKEMPTMVFLYSVHTDHAGHNYGWMSPEYITSIEEADINIGKLVDKLKEANLYKDTNFMLLTDHGGNPTSGHGGLTQQELEVPWAITGPGIKKGQVLKGFNNSINTSEVIAHLFNCKNIPDSWIGQIPKGIFQNTNPATNEK